MKQGVCHNCGEIKHLNHADICIDCQIELEAEAKDKDMENRIAREIAKSGEKNEPI